MKAKFFPIKYQGSWWVCYGTSTSFQYIYRHCWDQCPKSYPQKVCDEKNKLYEADPRYIA